MQSSRMHLAYYDQHEHTLSKTESANERESENARENELESEREREKEFIAGTNFPSGEQPNAARQRAIEREFIPGSLSARVRPSPSTERGKVRLARIHRPWDPTEIFYLAAEI